MNAEHAMVERFHRLHDRGEPTRPTADSILAGRAFRVLVPEDRRTTLAEEYTFRVRDRVWVDCVSRNGRAFYIGRINDFTGQVGLTRQSAWTEKTPAYRLLNRVLARVWGGDYDALERFGFRVEEVL